LKLVTAIIKPFKLDDVKETLRGLAVQGMTCQRSRAFGRQRGHTEVYRGTEYTVDFVPKVRVEIVVDDGDAQRISEAIVSAGANRQDRRRQSLDHPGGEHRADPHRGDGADAL